jgi:hypothetical protein
MSEIIKIGDKIVVTNESTKEYLIKDLEDEKARLEEELNQPEPSEEELIELGKLSHPYYEPKEHLIQRIKKIDDLLGTK